jgi:adenosine deaminase
MNTSLEKLMTELPKAELHIHIEGSLEPEQIFKLAKRNGVSLAYADVDALKKAYAFDDLQSFLDIYYAGTSVLLKAQDFYDMAIAYLERASQENILYTEIFFDPQVHLQRGVKLSAIFEGLHHAIQDAQNQWRIRANLILCFLRHFSEAEAFEVLDLALPYRKHFIGIGLDSSEMGNPPEKFARVFTQCRELGLHTVAHAGEEGPPEYIWQALKLLKIERVDHGIRCLEDPELVKHLAHAGIPLTVCPLSNLRLKVTPVMEEHPLKKLLDHGLHVIINSDDPAYFGGYMHANWKAVFEALPLNQKDAIQLACNSFDAAFIDKGEKQDYKRQVEFVVNKVGSLGMI